MSTLSAITISAAVQLAGAARDRLKTFGYDRRGNVAMMFGFSLIPILGAIGFGIDYGNAQRIRSKLQSSLDTATIAASKATIGRDDDVTPLVKAFLIENFTAKQGLPEPTVVASASADGKVKSSAKVAVPTSFMALFAFDKLTVAAAAEAEFAAPEQQEGQHHPKVTPEQAAEVRAAADRMIDQLNSARAALGGFGGAATERAFNDAIRSIEDQAAAAAAAGEAAEVGDEAAPRLTK